MDKSDRPHWSHWPAIRSETMPMPNGQGWYETYAKYSEEYHLPTLKTFAEKVVRKQHEKQNDSYKSRTPSDCEQNDAAIDNKTIGGGEKYIVIQLSDPRPSQ